MRRVRSARRRRIDGRRCFCGHRAVGEWSGWIAGPGPRPTLHLAVCGAHRCVVDWPRLVRVEVETAVELSWPLSGKVDPLGPNGPTLCDEFRWYT